MASRTILTTWCGHCGQWTSFKERVSTRFTASIPPPIGDVDGKVTEQQGIWRILQCTTCLRPALQQVGPGYDEKDARTILYPVSKTPVMGLPEVIDRAYRAALRVRDVDPSAFALLVGRTLEAICKHENAGGPTLAAKLRKLVSSDKIPRTLAQMADQLRVIRNLAAHDFEDEVTEADADIALEFIEAILEYLYVAPAKIAVLQERLQKRSMIPASQHLP